MTWTLFTGDGNQHDPTFPPAPPWRTFDHDKDDLPTQPRPTANRPHNYEPTFQADDDLVDAINASLHLRRPLLLTGHPGSGKSSVADAIAHEFKLGPPLRWPINSRSTLDNAMYRYDALGRLHHHQLNRNPSADGNAPADDIAKFLKLGPLGTALAASTLQEPRLLLIDELDKGELDLPGDLLNAFERGEYDIPELARHKETHHDIEGEDGNHHRLHRGRVRCRAFPIVVMTSNGERPFPAPFLRRCIRYQIQPPTPEQLQRIVGAHFNPATAQQQKRLIEDFAERLTSGRATRPTLAVDQLLNAIHIMSGPNAPTDTRNDIIELIFRELDRT